MRYPSFRPLILFNLLGQLQQTDPWIIIGADKLSNIVEAFPDLNLDWLITGKGKMTSTPVQPAAVEQTTDTLEENSVKYKNKYLEMLEENRVLRLEIEKLRKGTGTRADNPF